MASDSRLPAHLEVAMLIRSVNAAGGFAAVLHKGDPDAGTVLVVLTENGTSTRVYERMPKADGSRDWTCTRLQDDENKGLIDDYLSRRPSQDADAWIVELDIAQGERFIGIPDPRG